MLVISPWFMYFGFRKRGMVPGPAWERLKASIATPYLMAGIILCGVGAFILKLSFASTR
jgi:hypothetical protein